MIDQEVESLQSILNEQELQIIEGTGEEVIEVSDDKERIKLKKLLKVSLIPQCSKKFCMIDQPKDLEVELRCLPPVELFILLPETYPSNQGPLFLMPDTSSSNTLFYDQLRSFLYERLSEKWSEDSIVLYECAIYI